METRETSSLKDANKAHLTVEFAQSKVAEMQPTFDSFCDDFEIEIRSLQRSDRMAAFARCVFELKDISESPFLMDDIRDAARSDASYASEWANLVYQKKDTMKPSEIGAELDRGISIIATRAIKRKRQMAKFVQQAWDRISQIMAEKGLG